MLKFKSELILYIYTVMLNYSVTVADEFKGKVRSSKCYTVKPVGHLSITDTDSNYSSLIP